MSKKSARHDRLGAHGVDIGDRITSGSRPLGELIDVIPGRAYILNRSRRWSLPEAPHLIQG
jgi:hypothetical protein